MNLFIYLPKYSVIDCGRSFGNECALGQHTNSKAHAPVTSHEEEILLIVRSALVAFDTPSPRPMDFGDKPKKEVEFPRKDDATSSIAQFYEIQSSVYALLVLTPRLTGS
jgi:hypothetical protein